MNQRAIVTEILVLPEGMELDDYERRHWAIKIQWRGPYNTETGRGGYAIVAPSGEHLSKAGNWRYDPEPFIQRHYRWEKSAGLIFRAKKAANEYRVMGKTWPEMVAFWEEKEKQA